MSKYQFMTSDDFENGLESLVEKMTPAEILSTPGVRECLSEELNNEVLTAWEEDNPDKVWMGCVADYKPGCYGDGAHGHDHVRAQIADVLEDAAAAYEDVFGEPPLAICDEQTVHTAGGNAHVIDAYLIEDCVADLRNEMSDDASEEGDAVQWLNDNARVEGFYWGFNDGDFGLYFDEGEND